ncbi:hypothetical protein ANCCEY_04632 [Ancylostoma ceylanicum]|uniref:Uncharacterized protein n=1 Tax=Ancylostoma ceylanicum TaxID=53326 RepID=A0A0D6LW48_9BILA|nr:hypothetical protein ANCCEY_04632 [Ancylostoma ceylanicum]
MDPLRRLAKVVTTCCQKITNPKTQLNDEVVDLERSSSDTLETAQQRQEIEQEQSAGSKESTEKTEEKRVISNHSVNTTNASDESAEHKDPVVPRLKGGVGQSQKVRKLRQQQQLAGNEKDTQQKPSDEIVQPAQASCDPKNTESERILDYWTNPDGAAKKPGVEEKKGSGEGAAKKPSVEEKRRSGEAAAKKPGVEEKKGSDEGAAKKLSVEEKKGSAELHTANSAENEEPLVLSVIEEPHLIPPLLAAGPDMKQIAQVQHVRGQEAKPVKVTHSGESVKRKGQKGSQRLKHLHRSLSFLLRLASSQHRPDSSNSQGFVRTLCSSGRTRPEQKWQKFRSGKHAESNESHVPVQDEYAQKHPSRPSSAENLPQQKDPNAQKPSSKSSSAEGIAFLKVKFRSKTPRKASAETTGQPKGSIRQKLASLRQKVDPNQQKHHSRSSSAEDFAQQKTASVGILNAHQKNTFSVSSIAHLFLHKLTELISVGERIEE